MKLTLHTDYGLRVLLYLAFVDRQAPVSEIAASYDVSQDHLAKVIQALVRLGYVRTRPGRAGGVALARPADEIDVGQLVAELEGRGGVLDCVGTPEVCVLEPGCGLRRLLIRAEEAFFDTLRGTTIADLCPSPRARSRRGGLWNLAPPEAPAPRR